MIRKTLYTLRQGPAHDPEGPCTFYQGQPYDPEDRFTLP
jgi:hypothetical protein